MRAATPKPDRKLRQSRWTAKKTTLNQYMSGPDGGGSRRGRIGGQIERGEHRVASFGHSDRCAWATMRRVRPSAGYSSEPYGCWQPVRDRGSLFVTDAVHAWRSGSPSRQASDTTTVARSVRTSARAAMQNGSETGETHRGQGLAVPRGTCVSPRSGLPSGKLTSDGRTMLRGQLRQVQPGHSDGRA